MKREQENYSSNKKLYINFKQSDNTKRKNTFGRRTYNMQCAGTAIPSGIIMVGRREGVSHPDGSGGRGRRSFTFNCCFILPTIFFYHCNLEAKKYIPDSLFLNFN